MSEQILVQFAALAEASQNIQNTYNQLNAKLDDLKSQLAPLVAEWSGSASENYQAQQTKWNDAQNDLNTVLRAISSAVEQAHDAYTQTENANANAWM